METSVPSSPSVASTAAATSARASTTTKTSSRRIRGGRRRQKNAKRGGATTVVCTTTSRDDDTSVEWGLILSLLVMTLYVYGVLESVMALPEVPLSLGRRFGENWNVAKDEYSQEKDRQLQVLPHPPLRNNNIDFNDSTVQIPSHYWPASIFGTRDGKKAPEQMETILHPGDGQTVLSVPKFWSGPIHHGKLMSRDTAMRVGSCNEPDPQTGSIVRGDACPPNERTIYFAIASYRDFQCRLTIESAFSRAKNPHRIRIGVVDQIIEGEDPPCNEPIKPCETDPDQALCRFQDRVDVYKMEAGLSVGPVFARHIGHRLYRGEYYYTQSDAHVTWTKDWDTDIVQQMEDLHNEMAVLTTYLTDVQGSIDNKGHSLRKTRPIMCNTNYEGGGTQSQHLRHRSQPERIPAIRGASQMQPYWAAGFSFSRGHFVVNVPYDPLQPMVFQGEEMSIGIRGFSVGYDMYAPERSVCFHHYAVGNNAKIRNKVPHYWEHAKNYRGVGTSAMDRLLGIVHMNPEVDPSTWDHTEEDIYGLGGVRTPEKFYDTFGIDVVNKKTEGHLCRFVDRGGMHRQFTKFLRSDGMGIDYDRITYRFKDPAPNEK